MSLQDSYYRYSMFFQTHLYLGFQHQLSTLNQNQPNQLQRQQHLVQQPSAVDLDKFKRFSNGFDQVRFGSSGSFAPEQRYHQQQQMQEKPKLDLLSEQFSNQKLSQKLFNPPNPYSSVSSSPPTTTFKYPCSHRT